MRAGRLAALGTELGLEADPGAVDDHLSRMLEVHRDPLSDHRLHLPQSPVGTLGMAHQHPGLEEFVHPPSPGGGPPMSTPDLSALVSARLCHDLISPMGAIGNGLELMNISGTPGSAELALVCLEKSLPMGGAVRIRVEPGAISLAVEDRRTAPPAHLWAHLTEGAPVPDLKPDGVQFALLRKALDDTGYTIEASFTETSAALRLAALSPAMAEARP